MSRVIEKKVKTQYFELILAGQKTYELRLADWVCEAGDTLVLNEIDESSQLTGRSIRKRVGFVGKTKDFDFWSAAEIEQHGYQIISLLETEA